MSNDYEIPLLLTGEEVKGREDFFEYEREEDIRVYRPSIGPEGLEEIQESRETLRDLTVDDIISFYSEIGEVWGDENYDLRQKAAEISEVTTGYDEKMIERSYDTIADILSEDYLERAVEGGLGSKEYLDGWVEEGSGDVHLEPLGRVLHMLAGNVPTPGTVSMASGNLAKNTNIIKVSQGDPATPVFLGLTMNDIDETHPISETTSVLYWDRGSKAEEMAMNISDGITVWGGGPAVEDIRSKSSHDTELIEFGPGRGMQFIGERALDGGKIDETSRKAASDVIVYDQNACFSPQVAFIEKSPEKFCESLAESLDYLSEKFPKGYSSANQKAFISQKRTISEFQGDEVYELGSTEWTIIETDDIERSKNHPGGRTLYVLEVDDLNDAIKYVDESVRTVGVSPSERRDKVKDKLAKNGVDRITSVGRMSEHPPGLPQDGIYPLSEMGRWVSNE